MKERFRKSAMYTFRKLSILLRTTQHEILPIRCVFTDTRSSTRVKVMSRVLVSHMKPGVIGNMCFVVSTVACFSQKKKTLNRILA